MWSNGAGRAATDGVWRFAETKPISTYITCVVAGPYHYVTRRLRARPARTARRWRSRSARCAARALAPHFDADDVFLITKQGLDFFHDHFDYPYPFGKYDQAFVPEYNLGAMENPGLVTFREEYVFRGKVTRASYEAPGQRHPARDGAHVVRRPGHHGVVGRPVAQGVLRRLHGHLRERRRDPLRPTPGSPSPTAARPGPTAPTSSPPPTRSPPTSATWRTPSSTSTASPTPRAPPCSSSSSPTSGRTPSWRAPGATSSGTRTATPASATCWRCSEETSGRDMADVVAGLAADGGRQLADPAGAAGRRGPGRRARGASRRRPSRTRAAPAPGGDRPVPARGRRGAGAVRARRGGRRRAAHGGRGAGRGSRRPSWCWSTTTT